MILKNFFFTLWVASAVVLGLPTYRQNDGERFIRDGIINLVGLTGTVFQVIDYKPVCGTLSSSLTQQIDLSDKCTSAMSTFNTSDVKYGIYDISGVSTNESPGSGTQLCICGSFGTSTARAGDPKSNGLLCVWVNENGFEEEWWSGSTDTRVASSFQLSAQGKALPHCDGASLATRTAVSGEGPTKSTATATTTGEIPGGKATTTTTGSKVTSSLAETSTSASGAGKSTMAIKVAVPILVVILIVAFVIIACWFRRRRRRLRLEGLFNAYATLPQSNALGLNVVSEPVASDGNVFVDIVFIHGLTGGSRSTWTEKDSHIYWPQDLLPGVLTNARIMSFGYDGDVSSFWAVASQNRVSNHAQNLVAALAGIREQTNTAERPIIFVCHSLGGLVCEDALLTARNTAEPHLHRILNSTAAIAFFGTPHYGADLAKWASTFSQFTNLTGRSANRAIVDTLRPESEVLARIQRDFHSMVRLRANSGEPKLEITCFYEELPVRGIGVIVPMHAATLSSYLSIGIHSNHMEMVAFTGPNDPGFVLLLAELRRWMSQLQPR